MNSKFLILLFCSLLFSTSCQNQEKNISKSNSTKISEKIPMKLGENYFIKNTFQNKELVTKKISTQKEFDEIFGMATVMGKNGKPTKIDFTKEYVLAIINPTTDTETKIESINLEKKNNQLNFHYKITIGNKITYQYQPFLIEIVENKENLEVKFIKE